MRFYTTLILPICLVQSAPIDREPLAIMVNEVRNVAAMLDGQLSLVNEKLERIASMFEVHNVLADPVEG